MEGVEIPQRTRADDVAKKLKAAIDMRVETAKRYADYKSTADAAYAQAEEAKQHLAKAQSEFAEAVEETGT